MFSSEKNSLKQSSKIYPLIEEEEKNHKNVALKQRTINLILTKFLPYQTSTMLENTKMLLENRSYI